MSHAKKSSARSPQEQELDTIGKHLVFGEQKVGSQYDKKPKLMVPNCALIIPQRYKKDYEEKAQEEAKKTIEKSMKKTPSRVWRPGGKSV